MKKRTYVILFILVALLLSSCSSASDTPLSQTTTLFDTVISIHIYDKNSEEVLTHCIQKCEEYEKKFSRTLPESEIYRLNHAGGEALELSDDTVELIKLGLKYSELSEGRFDITIAPLAELWDFKHNTGTIPAKESIDEALSLIDYRNVRVEGNQVQLLNPDAAIDLGGIAKGYIADQLKAYMETQGTQHALIDLGGNVLVIGAKPDGSAFHIGIQKPFSETGEAITSVKIKNQAVVTSGNYQRYFKIEDKIYHHILNPQTGYPYENHLQSVTVLCDSSADADGLSTTLFALGLDEGMKYIDSLPSAEAVFITDDQKLHYSNGFPK
ncbi:FAD:protein FMN transferase [Roseburia hominis]